MLVSLVTWILLNNYVNVITSIVLVLIISLLPIILGLSASLDLSNTTCFNNMFHYDSQYFSIMLISVLLLLFLITTYNHSVKYTEVKQEQITLLILLLIAVSSLSSSVTIIALFASVEVQSLVLYLVLSTQVSTPSLLSNNQGSGKPSIVYLFNASCATALLLYSISVTSPLLLLVSILWKLGTMPVHAWMIPILDVSHSIISAVILSLSKYGLLVMVTLISSSSVMSHSLLYYISFINLIAGTIIALTQYRYIRILAWTSMIQIGYVLLIVHTNYHSISLLFFELYTAYTVLLIILFNNNRLANISNISQLMATSQILLMIAMLYSVAGIPYAALFWVKLDILLHVPTQSFTIALLITFLSSIVYVRLIKQLSFSQYSTY